MRFLLLQKSNLNKSTYKSNHVTLYKSTLRSRSRLWAERQLIQGVIYGFFSRSHHLAKHVARRKPHTLPCTQSLSSLYTRAHVGCVIASHRNPRPAARSAKLKVGRKSGAEIAPVEQRPQCTANDATRCTNV
jgi:hypothetical protein